MRIRNQLFGVGSNTLFRPMGEFGVGPIDAHLDRLRNLRNGRMAR